MLHALSETAFPFVLSVRRANDVLRLPSEMHHIWHARRELRYLTSVCFAQDDENVYLVQDICEGGDLQGLLKV